MIASDYIEPLLFDGFKHDYRCYFAVTSFAPLRAYVYHDFQIRFCTKKYDTANFDMEKEDKFAHLTHYSLNEANPDKDPNSPLSMDRETYHKELEKRGIDFEPMWEQIKDAGIKSLIAAAPHFEALLKKHIIVIIVQNFHNHRLNYNCGSKFT